MYILTTRWFVLTNQSSPSDPGIPAALSKLASLQPGEISTAS